MDCIKRTYYSTHRKYTNLKTDLVAVAKGEKKFLRPKRGRRYNTKRFIEEIKFEGVDRIQTTAD